MFVKQMILYFPQYYSIKVWHAKSIIKFKYLYMPETSIPTKITLTGNQTRTSFQLNFSTEMIPHILNAATIAELIKFCIKDKIKCFQKLYIYTST